MTPISNACGSVGDHHLVPSAVLVEDTRSLESRAGESTSTTTVDTHQTLLTDIVVELPPNDLCHLPSASSVTFSPARLPSCDDATSDQQLTELTSDIHSPQFTVDYHDFYNSSPISISTVPSHPDSDDFTFARVSSDSFSESESVASAVSDIDFPQSEFKPNCKKNSTFLYFS